MERSEPALVPEWLRCTGSVTGGGTSAHHFASSSSQSDVLSSTLSMRSRSSRSIGDKDSPHSAFLDRSTSSNSRRSSSSNSSTKHPYSSFSRSHRDKNREKDKERERSVIRDLWDHDCSDPLGNILTSRVDNITLRRSQSMVARKSGETLPRRALELKISGNINQNGGNCVLSGSSTVSGIQKAAFEKDFPSLGAEEKQGVPDIGRVPSPGLSIAVQSLPICNSGLIGGEGWTSALAEVPALIGSMGPTSAQQSVVATSTSGVSSAMVALNMAEALSQAPSRVRTTLQLPDKSQRLEELAIKQSRQLIPMTPSTPKPLVLNSSDKSKQPKTAVRTSEMIVAAKSAQQQSYSSQLANQSLRGGQVRSDAPKTSNAGKFLVLKPLWENGLSSMAKDVSSPTNNANSGVPNSQLSVAPSTPTAPLTGPNYPKLSNVERMEAVFALNPRSSVERKPSLSQAQSRSDFFNLMRKKTSVNSSAILPDSGSAVLSTTAENSGGVIKEVVSASVSPHVTENGSKMTSNGDTHEESWRANVGEKNSCLNGEVYPDEEEAAFLRSLGWDENAGEDESLTEEEINAFYQEYMKLRPSLKLCRSAPPKFADLSESCASNSGKASSELSSSESESESEA